MKNIIFTILCLSLLVFKSNAQTTVAKLKYEQAEEAFANGDYFITLTKLEEAEKILGEVNPKIMYLRIMAQSRQLAEDKSVLPALKKNCEFYLKAYDGNANLEEKYKEVYLVSESLMQYEDNKDYLTAYKFYNDKNYDEALNYFKKAAAQGYAQAMNMVGYMYYNSIGVTKDNAEANKWFQRAADKGSHYGYYNLGHMHYHGNGVDKNYNEALKFFSQSVEKAGGYTPSIMGVADCYAYGLNDKAKALEWYVKAATKGDVRGMYNSGWYFYMGAGTTKDYTKAYHWFTQAAEKGSAGAMDYLGIFYQNGYSVTADYQKAMEWYLKSAEKGNEYAPGHIAYLYENGLGVKKDKKFAKEWREKEAVAKAKK